MSRAMRYMPDPLLASDEETGEVIFQVKEFLQKGGSLGALHDELVSVMRLRPALGMTVASAELLVLDFFICKPWYGWIPSRLLKAIICKRIGAPD